MKDIVVIGAGVSGSSIAFFLKKAGADVTIIDKSATPPTGGSMAAGAFISPKIGKGSPLQKLTNEAFDFSWRFYKENFSEDFFQDGVLRLPKDERDCEKFRIYEEFNYPNYQRWDREKFKSEGLSVDCDIGFFFPDAGDCNGLTVSKKMRDEVELMQMRVEALEFVDNYWIIKAKDKILEAKRVILALGYESNLLNIDIDYMGIKALWGSRGDYLVNGGVNFSLHKDFSLSSVRDGFVKIGATHIKAKNPCMICDGNPLKALEAKAKAINPKISLKLTKIYCGYRSGSRDFFPVVGTVVDVKSSLLKYPNLLKGAKDNPIHYNGLYILNGVGGRGFVFAPYLANILAKHILDGSKIPAEINPDRLFFRWVRKLKNNKE